LEEWVAGIKLKNAGFPLLRRDYNPSFFKPFKGVLNAIEGNAEAFFEFRTIAIFVDE